MIDSHCHLADEVFADDLGAVVARARAAGVEAALCILDASNPEEAGRAVRVRGAWDAVRFAAGVHPHHAGRYAGDVDAAVAAVSAALDAQPGMRGLGEIGLDYHYDFAPRDVQQSVFAAQVDAAAARDLPIVIHTRDADADTLAILRGASRPPRGVFHCFTGDASLARAALDLGFHLSFSGIATFPKGQSLRDIAADVPHDRLLIETDSPYLAPPPHRGKRNEPAWVARVLEVLATVRGTTPEALASQTTANFRALFGG
jgi:TatD DNase family protein